MKVRTVSVLNLYSRHKISHCVVCLFKFEDDPTRIIILYSVFLCIIYYVYLSSTTDYFGELNIFKKGFKNILYLHF